MNSRWNELLQTSTMSLATVGADGMPHAAAVYFAAGPDLQLFFFSAEDSQHARDLMRDPRAAAAIYPECFDWQDIRGLQLRGEAYPLERGPAWQAAWQLYCAKFPFVAGLKPIVARNLLYAFQPHWMRHVDNRRRFGFKEEWTLP